MDLLTLGELLRHRPTDPSCAECFKINHRLVSYLIQWTGNTPNDNIPNKSAIDIRVSCQEALEKTRTCPIMGGKGYKLQLLMESTTVFPFATIAPMEAE